MQSVSNDRWGPHRRIAVIGSGVAGLSAAWLLSRRHDVVLYEADRRLGGHSNTVEVETPAGKVAVDTGFIVYNEGNYPNLTAMFAHLGVETVASDMSFAASLDNGRLEYSSCGLNGLVGQRRNLLRPRFWTMLRDVLRFYREAPSLLTRPDMAQLTLGEYLDRNGYAEVFISDHLLPMGAAIWSTTAREMRDYPLLAFVRFFMSHGLLQADVNRRPVWRTVKGGSARYVARLAAAPTSRIGARVVDVRRIGDCVEVTDAAGHRDRFDDVIIAAHADQALAMLGDADELERSVLGAFTYTDNTAVLHTDATLMPRRKRVWASWNYIGDTSTGEERQLCVSYWMNKLQKLDRAHPIFVTLNPPRPVAEGKLVEAIHYTHPVFDHSALAAQSRLPQLQGRNRVWFCGSYFGYGFHEDALQSGLSVAEAVGGVGRPWRVASSASRIAETPLPAAYA